MDVPVDPLLVVMAPAGDRVLAILHVAGDNEVEITIVVAIRKTAPDDRPWD